MNITACHPRYRTPARQAGAALVVSLLILLVLTVIGVSGLQTSVLEERMASNTHERNIAFQAAESALRDAENYLATITTTGEFTGTAGLFADTQAEPDYTDATTWTSDALSVPTTPVPGSAGARYFIKRVGVITGTQGALNLNGYGDNKGTGDVTTFRITGRGLGGNTDSAEVILRSYYGKVM